LENIKLPPWRSQLALLFVVAIAMPVAHGTWMALINNFAVERAAFNGADIGLLQSIREIPGFLSFAVIFLLLLFREQTLAMLALLILGLATAITGFFTSFWGLCLVTFVMSTGFHYFETVNQSLQLQWLKKSEAPPIMGKLLAAGSCAALLAYGFIYLALELGNLSMESVYAIGGSVTALLAVAGWLVFPRFPTKVEQHKKLILRRRYWLYYALTFMGGARRQIFVVFAGFLMVEKFGFSAAEITLMFLANMAINIFAAPLIGRWIARWGEHKTLCFEYVGLTIIFCGYALVDSAAFAVFLYILDHMFFAMAIAIKTYFQKIADPADIAPTAGVAFSINHIAAVVIPVCFGLLWLKSPSAVFFAGAGMAGLSLLLAQLIPRHPESGRETRPLRGALKQTAG